MKMINGNLIYSYDKACNLAYKKGKKLSELFVSITIPGRSKPGWIKLS
jgi:hypothetical protein